MRAYIPIAEIEQRDPDRARRIRERERAKSARLRAADPDRARAKGRELYARDPDRHAARSAAWREANPEKAIEIKRRYKEGSRAKYIVQSVRSEAKRKGVKFDLSEAWVQERLDRGVCELSGLPFDLDSTVQNHKNAPSVDRIIPGGHYMEANCRLVLFGLNSLLKVRDEKAAVERLYELRAS